MRGQETVRARNKERDISICVLPNIKLRLVTVAVNISVKKEVIFCFCWSGESIRSSMYASEVTRSALRRVDVEESLVCVVIIGMCGNVNVCTGS